MRLGIPWISKTHKLLCFIKIGLLAKAAVNSAMANNALKSRMKNITPPLVKTPALEKVSQKITLIYSAFELLTLYLGDYRTNFQRSVPGK